MTSSKASSIAKALLVTAIAAGTAGIASADDSSIGRFGGDSSAYFNGQPVQRGPSEWRAANPRGISERQLQGYSGVSEPWHLSKPAFTNVASDLSFKETHPNGLTVAEFQAFSSEASAWHSTPVKATATASTENGKETFADRTSAFFRGIKQSASQ
jgi:hypothetical protein